MSRYNIFLTLFIISVVAAVAFFIFYIQAIFGIVSTAHKYNGDVPDGFEMMSSIFSPQLLISLVIAGIASLAYRIQGIVLVARNKTVSDGEKALWIVGFVIMGFITAIVFLILAKGRKFVE